MAGRKIFLIAGLFAAALIYTSCKSTDGQPYVTQKDNAWSRNACGAFSLAYYLAETGQIPGSKVESTAKDIYSRIKFDPACSLAQSSSLCSYLLEGRHALYA